MKASNQKILDHDEVTAVSVNRSLLSVDYASMSPHGLKGFGLTHVIQKTSKFLTTFKKVTPGSRSPRLVSFHYLSPLAHHI